MKIYLIIILTLSCYNFISQVSLPYNTGFDNSTEQNGWVEYRKADTTMSHWVISGGTPYSEPNSLSHSYSPSSGVVLADNWFVSPAFNISSGGKLHTIKYRFSGFSSPTQNDTIAVYLLQGAQDPDLAVKTLLIDFRNSEYNPDNTYRIKNNIPLPASNDFSYIAIRYKNSNNSQNWLTVSFDDIKIVDSAPTTNKIRDIKEGKFNVYPNPSEGKIKILNKNKNLYYIKIYDIRGVCVFKLDNIRNKRIKLDLSHIKNGSYIAVINENNKTYIKKIIIKK